MRSGAKADSPSRIVRNWSNGSVASQICRKLLTCLSETLRRVEDLDCSGATLVPSNGKCLVIRDSHAEVSDGEDKSTYVAPMYILSSLASSFGSCVKLSTSICERLGVALPNRLMRCAEVIFLTILILGLPIVFPAGDAPETAFDESETLPYESVPLFSIVVPRVAAPESQEMSTLDHALPPSPSARVNLKATRTPHVQGTMPLLCIFRC